MKRALAILLAMALLTGLAACGNSGSSESGGTGTQPSEGTSGQPAEGEKQVVIGLNADYTTFDPAHSYEKTAHMIMPAMYDSLVRYDSTSDTGVRPNFATEWTLSEDGLTYVFTLRDDVVATTGKTLTAQDAEFAINRLINLKSNPSFLADPIESVTATGDYELTIQLKEITPSILALLAEPAFGVYDSAVAAENGATGDPTTDTAQNFFDQNSIGSGAFYLDYYSPNEQLVLRKSTTHWGSPANLDLIVCRQINDASMQLMSLQQGDIDFAMDLTAVQLDTLEGNENVIVNTFPTFDIFFLQMNMDAEIGGPLAVKEVRQAIAYALDYDGLCLIAGNGAKTPYNIIPDGFAGYLGESPITQDLDRARELLSDAGYAEGFSFDCGVIPDMAPSGVSFMDCAIKIKADLAEIGITMNIQSDEVSIYLDKLRNGEYQSDVGMWGPDFVDPATQLSFLPGETVGLRSNWTAEMAPELAELCAKAKVETDPAERVKLFEEIQEMYHELAGSNLVFLQPYRALPCSSRITNLVYTPSNMIDLAVLDVNA